MAGVISVGGLASGLDTNSIISQLVQIERRSVDALIQQKARAEDTRTAVSGFTSRLANVRAAALALKTSDDVLVRKAASSDTALLTAKAGSGAAPGTVTLTTEQLARVSIAGSTIGVNSADSTIATGAGTFRFQVGSGDVVSVDVDATTTLSQLVTAINDEKAGVTATAVNLGTSASPNYRLQLTTKATGASQTISILGDDTTLSVQTSQTGLNARFSVSGFTGTFERESNTFSDVLNGVTVTLKDEGTAQITVDDDTDAIVKKGKALASAFNDLVNYVAGESAVERQGDDVVVGLLATDSGVRRIVDRLHEEISGAVAASSRFPNLSSIGFATQKDGTLLFDESAFTAALAEDADELAAVFAGAGEADGVGARVVDLIDALNESGGVIAARNRGLDEDVRRLEDDIDAGERNVVVFEDQLRAQFAALENLVSSLQQQAGFLSNALRG